MGLDEQIRLFFRFMQFLMADGLSHLITLNNLGSSFN